MLNQSLLHSDVLVLHVMLMRNRVSGNRFGGGRLVVQNLGAVRTNTSCNGGRDGVGLVHEQCMETGEEWKSFGDLI